MSEQFNTNDFPSRADNIRALWVPVLLCPRLGSPENLVIGIAAATANDFHLAEANAWKRLHCLYSDSAETALLATRVALHTLKADLAVRGQAALRDPKPTFSGISLGTIREGEGKSLKQISLSWLQTLSSLYDPVLAIKAESALATVHTIGDSEIKSDRLPVLVFNYIEQKNPGLTSFFNPEIRPREHRQKRVRPQQVYIAFAGSKLVANFATLPPNRRSTTIDHIKRLMWDLEQERNKASLEVGLHLSDRRFEMIVQHQEKDDPQINDKQFNGLLEVVDELSEQGRARDIAVISKYNVPDIGNHMVALERAA